MFDYILGSLLAGAAIGAIPAIYGGVKGRLGLGIAGFFACIFSSLILGLLLSIPTAGVFVYYISQKGQTAATVILATHRRCPHCAESILIEANVCRFCGKSVSNAVNSIQN